MLLRHKYFTSSFISNFLNSVDYTISMTSMLSVVQANPLTTAMSVYISKDIFGQLFGSIYILKKSKNIDLHIPSTFKKAMIIQQTALVFEVLTPILPLYSFGYVASFATLLKNISYVKLGSINSKALYKLTTPLDHSETYSYLSISNNLASSLGIATGLGITHYISNPFILLSIMFGTSIVKILASYYGIKILQL